MSMDLRYFVRRSKVLQQYRTLLRAARALAPRDEAMARDSAAQVRREFRSSQQEKSSVTIAVMLKNGERQLEVLRALRAVGTGTGSKPGSSSGSGSGSGSGSATGTGTGWLGTTDEDGKDERGRVGQDWPWQR